MAASLWKEIDRVRERWDVLEHPFYQRWSAGGLGAGELTTYASEYDHAVVAIAAASRRAAEIGGGALELHADEEEDHIDLWRSFAKAAGWCAGSAWYYAEDPLPETVACARSWSGDGERSLAEHLVTLYAIESAQPRISQTKLDGLVRHYGFDEGPATEYFRLHALLDEDHAALMRATLDQLLPDADGDALLAQAEDVHRCYWRMLDGLEGLADS